MGITADRRWSEQAALFERRGATVMHGPAIHTLPVAAEGPLRRSTEDVIARPPDVLIANTGLGIRSWFANADSWGLGRALETALGRTRIYARGPKASGAVHSAGLPVAARAGTERLRESWSTWSSIGCSRGNGSSCSSTAAGSRPSWTACAGPELWS